MLLQIHVGKALYDESEDTVKGFKLTRNLTKKEKKLQKKREKANKKGRDDPPSETQTHLVSTYCRVPQVCSSYALMNNHMQQFIPIVEVLCMFYVLEVFCVLI